MPATAVTDRDDFLILEIREDDDAYDVEVRGTHLAELVLQMLPHLTGRELGTIEIAVLRMMRYTDPESAELLAYLKGLGKMPADPARGRHRVLPSDAVAALATTTPTPARAAAALPVRAVGLAAASQAPGTPAPPE